MPKLTEELLALYKALKAFPAESREYAAAFTNSNVTLDEDEFIGKWVQDWDDREEAAKKEEHRQSIVGDQFLELPPEKQKEIIAMLDARGHGVAMIGGAEANGESSEGEAHGETN